APRPGGPTCPRGHEFWSELNKVSVLVVGPGDELVIGPVRKGIAVRTEVVRVDASAVALVIHIVRVPLAVELRRRMSPPVKPNSELGVLEPFGRRRVLIHGRPVRSVAGWLGLRRRAARP